MNHDTRPKVCSLFPVLIALSFSGAAHAELVEYEAPMVQPIVSDMVFFDRTFLTPNSGFPMMSNDGREVVVLYGGLHFDGNRSVTLDVLDVPARQLRQRFDLQYRDEDFDSEGLTDAQLIREVRERLSQANRYLAARRYQTMSPFFRLAYGPPPSQWPEACFRRGDCEFVPQSPSDPERLPASTVADNRSVEFDFQTGVLTISRSGQTDGRASQSDLIVHWPVTETRVAQVNRDQPCRVQAAPREAWTGSPVPGDGRTVVLIRVSFLVEHRDCLQPDEWRVEVLSH